MPTTFTGNFFGINNGGGQLNDLPLGSGLAAETHSVGGPMTLTDNLDASPDGIIAVGSSVTSSTFGPVTIVGITSDGDPIIDTGSWVYLVSPTITTQDIPFTYSTSGSLTMCFCAGSMIETPIGPKAVETLVTGDLVSTADGHAVEIKWMAYQTISIRFGLSERLLPIRLAPGSLGDGLPYTDLTVTADHGMLIDGVICHAGALVNDSTITRVPLSEMGETFTVYHIETEAHEIILANGAPAETFIDNVSRRSFDNYAEFEALYGDVPEMEELPYPRAMSARQVPKPIRAKLDADGAVQAVA